MTDTARWDLIIIGSGICGLSAGLAYVLNSDMRQRKVLIVEKNPISGGYVTSFNRRGFQFDTCQMISNVSDIVEYFGIKLDFQEFDRDFIRIFKADTETCRVKAIELPSGIEAFQEQLIRLYPEDAIPLRRFFSYSSAMFHEIYGLKYAPRFPDIVKMIFTCPKVIRNASRTFDGYVSGFGLKNPELGLILQVFSSFCGLPNSEIAALLTVGVMYSLLEKAYRPQGPFIELPKRMEQRFRELGGELRVRSEVAELIIERRRAVGIRLKDGSTHYADHILSTIDVKATMQGLVGMETVRSIEPRYAERIESLEMTTSSFVVSLGLDDGSTAGVDRLRCGYALLTSGDDAFAKLYCSYANGESGLSKDCFYIGLSCPPAVAGVKPVLTIQAIPIPMGGWAQLRKTDRKAYLREKERVADLLIGIVERYLVPDLTKHIVAKDISSPATFARYSGSPTGSIYDMAAIPQNFGANRLPVKTPIGGLLLPKFAHGVFGAMNSGLQAVDILLDWKVMHGNSRFKRSR